MINKVEKQIGSNGWRECRLAELKPGHVFRLDYVTVLGSPSTLVGVMLEPATANNPKFKAVPIHLSSIKEFPAN